ncbi:uncharacterized protein LOC108628936 [Ceratina calcarata]|uniref:Uncharacterized protein LOC108628936 n=1 Tax=Ceratina calcarata TaxID=156304 RepID=A0AAJ7J7J1_9HYME|nr:uncharacterized protein LOC108628936 [Ceratina calcarata]
MAGIFNLFGDTSEHVRDSVAKPLSRSKTVLGTNGGYLKNVGQSRPKGLSIRSNSVLNVPATPNKQEAAKQQESTKLKLTQIDKDDRAISPTKHPLLKKESVKAKDASPKLSLKKDMKLPTSSDKHHVFKRPCTPKNHVRKSYREPEILAPYYDMQFELDDIYTKPLENEFRELFMRKRNRVVVCEDKGFALDRERINVKVPEFNTSPKIIDNYRVEETVDLPAISD